MGNLSDSLLSLIVNCKSISSAITCNSGCFVFLLPGLIAVVSSASLSGINFNFLDIFFVFLTIGTTSDDGSVIFICTGVLAFIFIGILSFAINSSRLIKFFLFYH